MEKIYPSVLHGPISVEQAINHGNLLNGVFSVKESGIDSKTFHAWKLEELLPTVPKGGWAKLSFIDYLWLQTLETMRKFGCSKKLMKAVCKALFTKAYEENLNKKTLIANIDFITKLKSKRALTYSEETYLNACETTLNDPIQMATTNFDINYFYQLVLKCFIHNHEVGLVIFEDGSFSTYEITSTRHEESYPINLSVPHILIPISSFIKKFIVDEEKEQFLTTTGILNDQEYEVVKQIRNKNVKSITITFDDNTTIRKIETATTGLLQGNDAKLLMQQLGMKNYSSIHLQTRDERTLSFTQTNTIYKDKK